MEIAEFFVRQFNNLPAQLTPLIGRDQAVTAVCTLLQRPEVRLLTLTGTGGVGKTRLGLQVAMVLIDVFIDGVCFVSLAPIRDPKLVIPTIVQTLGLWEPGDRSLLEHLKDFLQAKHVLLLLDNFEQVLSVAPVLIELLQACPSLKILVTSREVLHIQGEYEFPVPPLEVPDLKQLPAQEILAQVAAVDLFIARAQAIQPSFQFTSTNARTIAQICVRLDGLPLAIELAAARTKLLSPQALLSRLSQRLDVLTAGARDLPVRQQTLRNTLQWSYDLLNAEEQYLFRQLSVFVDGCSLEAATAISQTTGRTSGEVRGPLPQVLEGVASLLDKSLLLQTEQEDEEPRLVMLETIHEFGLEQLRAHGELQAARYAHADYYLHLAEEAHEYLFRREAVKWFERLEQEYGNFRAAIEWALESEDTDRENPTEIAVRLGSVLWRFWTMHGYMSEGRIFLERVLTKSEKSREFVRTKVLIAAAMLAFIQEDFAWEENICPELLTLSQKLGDRKAEATALFGIAGAALYRRDHTRAGTLAERALAMFRSLGDTWMVASVLLFLARLSFAQGEDDKTKHQLEESLVIYRALGYPGDIAWALIYLARHALKLGEQTRAHVLLQKATGLCREVGNRWTLAHALGFLGQLALEQGDFINAHALLTESLQLNEEAGNRRSVAWSLFLLANTVELQGDSSKARILYEQSLTIATVLGHRGLIASCLQGLAIALTAQERLLSAAWLWGAAETIYQNSFTNLPKMVRTNAERAQDTVRTHLGEEVFAQALAEGRTMTPEQILTAQESATISLAPEEKQFSASPTPLARKSLLSPAGLITREMEKLHPVAQGLTDAQGRVTLPQPLPPAPSSTPPVKPAPTYPDGLTAREVEVLRVVAQGLTNEQVAGRLVISPRTVDTHLTSIYRKIGASSRSAATRYAIEHHLV